MQFKISKIEDWQEVIQTILPQLQHNILLLKGNLGAGKTTFTQFLLKNLGNMIQKLQISFVFFFVSSSIYTN